MAEPKFGPGGNSESFYAQGKKSSRQAPEWVKTFGLDAYEYQCGNGVTGSDASFLAVGAEAKKHGIKMLYVSTDYVFPGNGTEPFEADSEKGPLNVYGLSKLKGEEAVKELLTNYFIVRTSWVFGEKHTNFIATMLRLSETRSELNVVDDQIGSPTYSKDLAKLIYQMIKTERYGTYHGTNEGFCSWCELAKKAFAVAGKSVTVNPVASEEFPTKATRPKNSRLSKKCLDENGFERLPDWEDAVERYLKSIQA